MKKEKKQMICIVCPVGCRLEVKREQSSESGISVTGNECKKGIVYGIKELTNPTRVLTTTVKIKNAYLKRLPVRTNGAVPRGLIFECMRVVNETEVQAPIKVGKVIINNVLDTGIDLISSRSMKRI